MPEGKISIVGLDKAAVLAVLYNASKPQGMGFLHYDPKPMAVEEAQIIINNCKRQLYFDYLKGRVMKIDLSSDEFNPSSYDRDNGQGAAERAIEELRKTGKPNSAEIQQTHLVNTLASAEATKEVIDKKTTMKTNGGVAVIELGLADVADKLKPAIDKGIEKLTQ